MFWLQVFLKYGPFQRTKIREGKRLLCFKFSQNLNSLRKRKNCKTELHQSLNGLINVWVGLNLQCDGERQTQVMGLNSVFTLKSWKAMSCVFLARCTTLPKYFLQQRGHNKVKINLKSCFKDRRKRQIVCNSLLHICFKCHLKFTSLFLQQENICGRNQ